MNGFIILKLLKITHISSFEKPEMFVNYYFPTNNARNFVHFYQKKAYVDLSAYLQ